MKTHLVVCEDIDEDKVPVQLVAADSAEEVRVFTVRITLIRLIQAQTREADDERRSNKADVALYVMPPAMIRYEG